MKNSKLKYALVEKPITSKRKDQSGCQTPPLTQFENFKDKNKEKINDLKINNTDETSHFKEVNLNEKNDNTKKKNKNQCNIL